MNIGVGDLHFEARSWVRYRTSVRDFAAELLGFNPEPRQAEVLDITARRGILCCHRQWGKSTTTAAKAVHHAVFNDGSLALILAPTLRQSGELLRAIARFARKLGLETTGDGLNRISLAFPNGSRIVAIPADENNIRGFSAVSLLLVDEAARVPDDVYYAVLPMLSTTDGGIWLMSTPKGRTGFFYETWTAADPEWTRILGTVEDSPRITAKVLASHREQMPEDRFREEYLCGFHDAEEQLFSSADIDAAFDPAVSPLRHGQIDIDLSRTVDIHYCIGVDLGQARDYTVIAGLEVIRELGNQTDPLTNRAIERQALRLRYLDRVPLETTYSAVAARIKSFLDHPHFRWAKASLVIDYTGVGRGFRDILSLSGVSVNLVPVTITGGSAESGKGSSANVPKSHLVSTLQILLQNRRLVIAPDLEQAGIWKLELENFRRNAGDGYRTSSSRIHDDTVLATALAAWYAARRYRGLLPCK